MYHSLSTYLQEAEEVEWASRVEAKAREEAAREAEAKRAEEAAIQAAAQQKRQEEEAEHARIASEKLQAEKALKQKVLNVAATSLCCPHASTPLVFRSPFIVLCRRCWLSWVLPMRASIRSRYGSGRCRWKADADRLLRVG